MAKAKIGETRLFYAPALSHLANFYQAQARYGDAEQFFKQSLAIYEKAHGPEHSHVAMTLNNLAVLHSNLRDNGRALDLIRRVVAIYRSRSLAVGRQDEA